MLQWLSCCNTDICTMFEKHWSRDSSNDEDGHKSLNTPAHELVMVGRKTAIT